MEFASVIFCRQCGSRYVEVSEWTGDKKAVFRCRTCGYHEEVKGFTLGRGGFTTQELNNARDTKAGGGKYER